MPTMLSASPVLLRNLFVGVSLLSAACSGGRASSDAGGPPSPPVPDASAPLPATAIALDRMACALVEGTTYCWGGNANLANRPDVISGFAQAPSSIFVSSNVGYALVGGQLYQWTGLNSAQPKSGTPTGLTALAPAFDHQCAIVGGGGTGASGRGTCWGRNNLGQLGDGTRTDQTSPVEVKGLPGPLDGIAAGGSSTCALSGGDVYCWGDNDDGQLGDGKGSLGEGPLAFSVTPVKVLGLPGPATAVVSADLSVCALVDGSVFCWGCNREGQLGDGTKTTRNTAAQVPGLGGVTALAGGGRRMCALSAGTVSCWGFHHSPNPNAPNPEVDVATSPVPVDLPAPATAIATSNDSTCAVVSGSIYCWGENHYGELGNGTLAAELTPQKVDLSNAR